MLIFRVIRIPLILFIFLSKIEATFLIPKGLKRSVGVFIYGQSYLEQIIHPFSDVKVQQMELVETCDNTPNSSFYDKIDVNRQDLLEGFIGFKINNSDNNNKILINLENLPQDILYEIFDYFDQSSLLNMRACSKRLLIDHSIAMNRKFLSKLKPKMLTSLDHFDRNLLASTHLLPFRDRLTEMSESNYFNDFVEAKFNNGLISPRMKDELDELAHILPRTNDFDSFLITALAILNHVDSALFWRLTEALLKIGIFSFEDVDFIPNLSYQRAFDAACEFNLKYLCNYTLYSGHYFDKRDGLIICIQKDNIELLKSILEISSAKISIVEVSAALNRSIVDRKIKFVKLIHKTFSQEISWLTMECIFASITARASNVLEYFLKENVYMFSGGCRVNGKSPLEYAVIRNYRDGIKLIAVHLKHRLHVRLFMKCILSSIQMRSLAILDDLMSAFENNFGPFQMVIQRQDILFLIQVAMDTRNIEILKFLLKKASVNILSASIGDNYNPMHNVINFGYRDYFMSFYEVFGESIFNVKDHLGRTPLLIAASCGNMDMIRLIAEIDVKQLKSTDKYGNTVLHIIFKHFRNPMQYVYQILDLNLIWDQVDNDGRYPIDLFLETPDLTDEDIARVYLRCAKME